MKNKKNITLGALVAVLGTTVAMGTSYALYQNELADKVINIGANVTQDGALTIGTVENDTGANLAPDIDRTFDFDISFKKNVSSTYTQNYYLAQLKITITSDSQELLAAIKANSSITVENEAGNYFTTDGTTASYWKNKGYNKIDFSDVEVTGEGTYTLSDLACLPLPVNASTVEDGAVEALKASAVLSIGDSDILEIDAASYDIDIDLTAPEDYGMAYVVGDFNNWQEVDAYMMVPSPKSDDFEWTFQTSANEEDSNYIPAGAKYKTKQGGNFSPAGDGSTNLTWTAENVGKSIWRKSGNGSTPIVG